MTDAPASFPEFVDLHRGSAGVIAVDPPWRFLTFNGRNPKIDRHYAQMSFDAIKALDIDALAAPNCVVALWYPQAMGHLAYQLVKHRGFTSKTQGTWVKQSKTGRHLAFGTGYIFRSAAEYWIHATRGRPKQSVHDVRNVIVAPVREHSRKPDAFFERYDRMYPSAKKIELFSRMDRRPGWILFGDQIKYWYVPAHDAKGRPGSAVPLS